jgi:hypothetical protein
MLFFNASCSQVNVYSCIQLIEEDVDVIGSYTRRDYQYALAITRTSMRHKFPVLYSEVNSVEKTGYCRDPSRIAYNDYIFTYLLR